MNEELVKLKRTFWPRPRRIRTRPNARPDPKKVSFPIYSDFPRLFLYKSGSGVLRDYSVFVIFPRLTSLMSLKTTVGVTDSW
jgi:hypothetical protein